MERFLNIQHLESGYSKSFLLKNISLNIDKGSFTGIIGPNGSGKTTLFKTLTSELPILKGNISFKGVDLSSITYKQKAQNFAIVTQSIEAINVSVEDYVLMGRLAYKKHFQFFETKKDYEIAHKYMQLTDVFKYKNKMMYELSGGEQQLVSIARALTQEPEILLLDEPTSHLDIMHQVQILNLLQELNEKYKLTILIIIHDLNLAGEYCSNLIMMNNGSIHMQGNPDEVLTYSNIETVYNTVVITKQNPLSKKTAVFLVSAKTLNSMNNSNQ